MGAGASMDPNLGFFDGGYSDGERYFCHSCHRVFGLGNVQNPQDFYCPHCQSTFLEEIGSGSDSIAVRHRTHGGLTIDQTRRITSATAMLRLLESQLREELETLHMAFAAASARTKQKQLTKLMKSRLRNVKVNLDMACSQPSCPICSEDFVLGNESLRLPCSHIFHDTCVMPWLEMKQNCPICRAELSDTVPSETDLEPFSVIELKSRLREFNIEDEVLLEKEKSELITLLIEKYKEFQEAEARAASDAVGESSSALSFPILLNSGTNPASGGFGGGVGGNMPIFGLNMGSSSNSSGTGGTGGPSALLLQRRSMPFARLDDDDDDDDDEGHDRDTGSSSYDSQFGNVRLGLRYVPANASEPSQIRMPWERHNFTANRHLAELLEDDDDDDMPPLVLAGLGGSSSPVRRGFPSSSSYAAAFAPSSIPSVSSSASTTYQIVPRNGGSGGYEAIAMRPTSLPASQLSSLLLGVPHIQSTNATEGSASSEEDSVNFSPNMNPNR